MTADEAELISLYRQLEQGRKISLMDRAKVLLLDQRDARPGRRFFEATARLLSTFSIDDRVSLIRRACELYEARKPQKGGSVVKLRLVKREQEP